MDSTVALQVRAVLAQALLEPVFKPLERTLGPVASTAFSSFLQSALAGSREAPHG